MQAVPNLLTLIMSTEDSIIFVQNDFAEALFPVFEEMKRMGKFCDVTLKVEDKCFKAHRIILAGAIPYFHAMFTHDMVKSTKDEVTIKNIDPEALEPLINFAYSGKVQISTANVQSLLVGSSFLQLHQVREACCDFLKKRLHPNNALGIRTFADALGCSTLVDATNRYIQKYFIEVSHNEEFVGLSFADVRDIISRDELHVTEEQVFEAVMRWVKSQSSRQKYFPELLTKVRMPLLTPEYLTDHVATEDFIRSSHQCRDLLDEAKDFHLMPKRRRLLQSFRTQPRCCPDIVGCIYALGGFTKSGYPSFTVEVYDPKIDRWEIAESMHIFQYRFGVAVMHNKLYVIGGRKGPETLSTVEVYDPEAKSWSTAASMDCERSSVGAATLFNKLYVYGGHDADYSSLDTVDCYEPENNEWSMVTSMSRPRSLAGFVASEDHIYVLGGWCDSSITNSVERYDPHSGQWIPMPSMPSKRYRFGVATLNGKIYVCGGLSESGTLKTAEVYNLATKKWTYIASMNVKRTDVALVANCGKLYAIGGSNGKLQLNTVEVYNPEIKRWDFVASMCAKEGAVGVTSL